MIGITYFKFRPYHCDICDKNFFRSSTLNAHKKIHLKKSRSKRKRSTNKIKKKAVFGLIFNRIMLINFRPSHSAKKQQANLNIKLKT